MENVMRPSWDNYFMARAYLSSVMSTCASGRKVGAVFVKDKREIVSGFNAVPSGYPHPTSCKRRMMGFKSGEAIDLCVCKHAEENAITNATRHGVSLMGSTLYVTTQPCQSCMGDLANAGIDRVIYNEEYKSEMSTEIADKAGITVDRISDFDFKNVIDGI